MWADKCKLMAVAKMLMARCWWQDAASWPLAISQAHRNRISMSEIQDPRSKKKNSGNRKVPFPALCQCKQINCQMRDPFNKNISNEILAINEMFLLLKSSVGRKRTNRLENRFLYRNYHISGVCQRLPLSKKKPSFSIRNRILTLVALVLHVKAIAEYVVKYVRKCTLMAGLS